MLQNKQQPYFSFRKVTVIEVSFDRIGLRVIGSCVLYATSFIVIAPFCTINKSLECKV